MTWDGVWTHVEVLNRLPPWMVSDFDCPDRGPHEWLWAVPQGSFNEYGFCRYCERKRRGPGCLDTRPALEVIYDMTR